MKYKKGDDIYLKGQITDVSSCSEVSFPYEVNTADEFINVREEDIVSVNEPEKPVVPQFVADYIDSEQHSCSTLFEAIDNMDDDRHILVEEPQKVTVPKFVAEWIKKHKEDGSRLSHALEDVFDDVELSLYIKQQEDDYTETIAEAWIAYPNITVEQEKLYTVKVLDSTLFKMTSDNHVRYKLIGENEIPSESKIGNYTFEANLTEKEIKEADERLWQWAKEV